MACIGPIFLKQLSIGPSFRRISWTPSLIGISNAAKFHAAVEAARQRSRIRKHSLEESARLIKAANPGKLKQLKDYITWSSALNNYLSTILGQYIVPLRYMITEYAALNYTIESKPDYNFDQLLINCIPLTGLTYNTDTRKVYQFIHGLLKGETAETWIKPK